MIACFSQKHRPNNICFLGCIPLLTVTRSVALLPLLLPTASLKHHGCDACSLTLAIRLTRATLRTCRSRKETTSFLHRTSTTEKERSFSRRISPVFAAGKNFSSTTTTSAFPFHSVCVCVCCVCVVCVCVCVWCVRVRVRLCSVALFETCAP